MNTHHGRNIKIFAANSNVELAKEITKYLGVPLGNARVTKFSDGEISMNIYETVRGSDVFVIQSTCSPVNTHLMELLIMIDAFKRASAAQITAVIPYYGYSRQDKGQGSHHSQVMADLPPQHRVRPWICMRASTGLFVPGGQPVQHASCQGT